MFREEENKILAHDFYRDALNLIQENQLEILIGGGFALKHHTGINRQTKDLDLFCKPGDMLKILKVLSFNGYKTEITDARWIAKAFKDNHFIDLIFNTVNNLCPVDESWFQYSQEGELYGKSTRYISAEELLWCKIYIQSRDHYDGADVNHIILRKGKVLDWKRILGRLDQHWHLLLGQLLNFQFIYPSERDVVPRWLFDDLLERAKEQFDLPAPIDKICRGPLVEHTHYNVDIMEWGFKIITTKKL
ncbi:MAG: nucleotidyltransferase [Cytophagaceae bacterium]